MTLRFSVQNSADSNLVNKIPEIFSNIHEEFRSKVDDAYKTQIVLKVSTFDKYCVVSLRIWLIIIDINEQKIHAFWTKSGNHH